MQKDQVEFLASHGLIESALVFCGPEGIELYITARGKSEVPLHTARGQVRVFASIDTAVRFLVSCGWHGRGQIDVSSAWIRRVKE